MWEINKSVLSLAAAVCFGLACQPTALAASHDGDVQAEFDAAMAAMNEQRLNTARRLLNALLADNPTLHRARLELARANYLSSDFAAARREAERVLEDPDVPPGVRTNVLAFLAQIREDERDFAKRHRFQPTVYFGGMYDSNVNFGVDRDIVNIGGTQFLVAPGSQEDSDFASVIDVGLAHTYNPGTRFDAGEDTGFFVWQSQVSGYYRGYLDLDDFNLGVLTLRTGPAWFVPGRWQAGIGLQGDKLWLGDSGLGFFTSINPNVTWQFDDEWELTLEGIFSYRDYDRAQDTGREGWYRSGNVRVGKYFNNGQWGVQGGIGYFDFDADDARFGNNGVDIFVGVVAEAWTNGSVYARAGYRLYDFDGPEPVIGVPRDDDEYRFIAGFQHRFSGGWLRNWALQGEGIYTDNSSNSDLFDYDRYQLSLGLARSF